MSFNKILESVKKNNLFEIVFLDKNGDVLNVSADSLSKTSTKDNSLVFKDTGVFDGEVYIYIDEKNEKSLSLKIDVVNNSEYIIESIKFPIVELPCKLKEDGGDSALFWPSMEGTLIEKANNRYYSDAAEKFGGGYTGLTPGPSAMQFMALYSDKGGIYYASHDENSCVKDFEYYFNDDNTVRFECKHYVGGVKSYKMPFDMVISEFEGDWQDAAEIYRTWLYSSNMSLPKKLVNRTDLPGWLFDSPITLIYPVRGRTDKDCDEDMIPNCYYPYSNILPYVDELAEKLESRIMPLVMHWEGSAPWSNPYIWPPYGDKDDFDKTVKALHKKGHLVGLYASGIGFTTKSVKDSKYENVDAYLKEGWDVCACRDRKSNEIIVTDLNFVREGYEACSYCEKTKATTINEALKIAEADIDYFQAFDQNLGGMPHFCWSKEHGHSPAPGKWMSDSMEELFTDMNKAIKDAGKEMLFGCELAAAEPMIKHLPFNDIRWFTALRQGRPVPAYSYIYHEYTNNFMGNQNGLESMIDFHAAPDNLLYRAVYAFLAGDTFSLTLGDSGNVTWGWNAPFFDDFPETEHLFKFMKMANKWRNSFARKYLCFGKVLKTKPADCEKSISFVTLDGRTLEDATVLNRRFEASDGTIAEFFVNRTFTMQKLKLKLEENAKLYRTPEEYTSLIDEVILNPGEICCVIK